MPFEEDVAGVADRSAGYPRVLGDSPILRMAVLPTLGPR